MKKLSITIGGVLLGAGLILAAHAADAAAPVKGTWSLNNWTPGDTAHLTLAYRNATTRWERGNDQPLEDLHGLTSEQRHSAHASVSFTMDRDASTFAFEGALTLGLGRGEFRFVPNPTYAAKLGVLGYGTIGRGRLRSAAPQGSRREPGFYPSWPSSFRAPGRPRRGPSRKPRRSRTRWRSP